MQEETCTPKAQGFLINVKRIRVSRGLSSSRDANMKDKGLIIPYLTVVSKE